MRPVTVDSATGFPQKRQLQSDSINQHKIKIHYLISSPHYVTEVGGVGEDESLAAGLAFESRQVCSELCDIGAPGTGAVKQPGVAQVGSSPGLTAPNVQIVHTDLLAFLDSPDNNLGD